MFRVLYCNIGAEGQPDRTSTVSTDVDAVRAVRAVREAFRASYLRSPLDVQSLITSLKFK